MNIVITWMYSSPPGENIHHSQVGTRSSDPTVQNYYWRCVFLLFESSHRLNRDVRHVLFVNKQPPAQIDGVDTATLIRQYGIEVVEFEHLTLSPSDYYGAWNTQFLVLDVLDWAARYAHPDDAVFVLDSDIVFVKPIGGHLLSRLRQSKALLYSLDMPVEYVNNGLTGPQLLQVARELNASFQAERFVYSGGEFICLLGSETKAVSALARQTYEQCLDRHRRGLLKFNEEAHLLSFVYQVLGYPNHSANDLIKRIWTDRSIYANVTGDEDRLVMWHLPSEKKTGFVKLFRALRAGPNGYTLESVDLHRTFRLRESLVDRLKRHLIFKPARLVQSLLRSLRAA